MDKQRITNLLDKIPDSEVNEIKLIIDQIKQELNEEFNELKKLLNSESWPEAVMSFQICNQNSEQDKMDRAEGVIDILIDDSLKNKKFLDFGCGEGHMAKYASSQETLVSVGYDAQVPQNTQFIWQKKQDNFLLTSNLEVVKSEGPYDVILIYDVLDHSINPTQVLKEAKSLLSKDGKIYLRCHPWCGRHGGHLYNQVNKAFVHLVFTKDELNQMGYKTEDVNMVYFPIATYHKYITDAGFEKTDPEIDSQDVEDFFYKNEIIKQRILSLFGISEWKKEKPEFQMGQCFLDFVLKIN